MAIQKDFLQIYNPEDVAMEDIGCWQHFQQYYGSFWIKIIMQIKIIRENLRGKMAIIFQH